MEEVRKFPPLSTRAIRIEQTRGKGAKDNLTDEQLKVIPFHLAAPSIEESCKRARISDTPIHSEIP